MSRRYERMKRMQPTIRYFTRRFDLQQGYNFLSGVLISFLKCSTQTWILFIAEALNDFASYPQVAWETGSVEASGQTRQDGSCHKKRRISEECQSMAKDTCCPFAEVII